MLEPLDPMAEGVLPVLLGKATRLQDYLLDSNKIYEFDIEFGYETTSLDADGEVLERCEYSHVTKEAIDKALRLLLGSTFKLPHCIRLLNTRVSHYTSMQEREGLRGSSRPT